MFNYFIWNLPHLATQYKIKSKLQFIFGNARIDIFAPQKPQHRFHGGCARVICKKYYEFGSKSELHIGCRFPAYVKHSEPQIRRSFKVSKLVRKPSALYSRSPSLDLKTDSTCLSISVCDSINVVKPTMTTCDSIDIMPCSTALSLVQQSCTTCNIEPHPTAASSLDQSTFAYPERSDSNHLSDIQTPPLRNPTSYPFPTTIPGVFMKCQSCCLDHSVLQITKCSSCGSSNLKISGWRSKEIIAKHPFWVAITSQRHPVWMNLCKQFLILHSIHYSLHLLYL